MNSILKTSAIFLVVAIAGPALAATSMKHAVAAPDMNTCQALMQAFDAGLETTTAAIHKVDAAKAIRAAADKHCKAGNYGKGVMDLHAALADINVKAKIASSGN